MSLSPPSSHSAPLQSGQANPDGFQPLPVISTPAILPCASTCRSWVPLDCDFAPDRGCSRGCATRAPSSDGDPTKSGPTTSIASSGSAGEHDGAGSCTSVTPPAALTSDSPPTPSPG